VHWLISEGSINNLSLTDRETLLDFNYQPCEVAGCHISPAHSGSSLTATYNNVVQNV